MTSSLGVTSIEAGHVYRFKFGTMGGYDSVLGFNEEDLKNTEKCIQVTVTVEPWQVETITPSFK